MDIELFYRPLCIRIHYIPVRIQMRNLPMTCSGSIVKKCRETDTAHWLHVVNSSLKVKLENTLEYIKSCMDTYVLYISFYAVKHLIDDRLASCGSRPRDRYVHGLALGYRTDRRS